MFKVVKKLIAIPFRWREISQNPLLFFTKRTVTNNEIIDLELFPHFKTFLLCKPEYIEHVLVKNNRKYHKSKAYKFLKIVLGNGLLTSDGEFWRRQRRIAQPAFHKQVLASFTKEIESLADNVVTRWNRSLEEGNEVLNIADEMMKLTVSITANLLFGADISKKEERILFLVGEINEKTSNFLKSPVIVPLWIPTPGNKIFNKQLDELNQIINEIIETRRKNPAAKRNDLLQMLMDSEDEETGEKMNDQQLKDEVMTLFLAGSETSSNALAWTLLLLSNYHKENNKVLDEIHSVVSEGLSGLDALKSLKYLNLVMQEALRMYPPAWILAREAIQDDEIGGIKIKKGSQVYISIHGMHQHPKYWNEPEKFIPERFNDNQRPKYSYFPFGGGPRFCIGAELAKMEIILTLYKLLQHFKFQNINDVVFPEPLITLRPKNGLYLKISKIDSIAAKG